MTEKGQHIFVQIILDMFYSETNTLADEYPVGLWETDSSLSLLSGVTKKKCTISLYHSNIEHHA